MIAKTTSQPCNHNQRTRFTTGFYCEDCDTFFSKDSPTYRKSELLTDIYLALHNVNVMRHRDGLEPFADIVAIKEKIRPPIDDYEQLVAEAKVVMQRHGTNADSAMITIR